MRRPRAELNGGLNPRKHAGERTNIGANDRSRGVARLRNRDRGQPADGYRWRYGRTILNTAGRGIRRSACRTGRVARTGCHPHISHMRNPRWLTVSCHKAPDAAPVEHRSGPRRDPVGFESLWFPSRRPRRGLDRGPTPWGMSRLDVGSADRVDGQRRRRSRAHQTVSTRRYSSMGRCGEHWRCVSSNRRADSVPGQRSGGVTGSRRKLSETRRNSGRQFGAPSMVKFRRV